MTTLVRQGLKRFYDDRKFPRGFQKSGDFTLAEAETLSLYGYTLNELDSGRLLPENDEEKRFVLVNSGQLPAETCLEKAWCKYIRLARGRRNFFGLTETHKTKEKNNSFEDEVVPDD